MLHINRTTKWVTFSAVCLIVFAGSLRLVQVRTWAAADTPLACLRAIIYVSLLLGWGISLEHRLTDGRVKGLLYASIALMILWFVLRCAKYDFFDSYDSVLRRLWYGYYIPMNFLPTLSLLAAQYVGALGIIFYKCRISKSRRLVWLPVIWVLIIIAFFFWYNANQFLPIRKPFQMTEMCCIVIAAVWESCIQTGLIPSNIGYREFFNASKS